jgi:TPR repeat protein
VRNAQRPTKDMRQAVRWYERALECGGDFPEIRFNLATALFERGEWAAAQVHAKLAAPHMGDAREMLGFINLAMETRPEIRTTGGVNMSLHGMNTYFMKGNPGCPGRRGRR